MKNSEDTKNWYAARRSFPLYPVLCALCPVPCALCSVPCALCPVPCALCKNPPPPLRGGDSSDATFVLSCSLSCSLAVLQSCSLAVLRSLRLPFSHSSSSHLVSFPPFSYLCAIFSKRFWNINLLIRWGNGFRNIRIWTSRR